jgi:iron complex outermembrane receptor protein
VTAILNTKYLPRNRRPTGTQPAAVFALLLLLSPGSFADSGVGGKATGSAGMLEEIVVTAELRDTPWLAQSGSSSVISAGAIARRSAVHLEEILQLAPNVNLAGGTSRARFYQIRGIGERSQFVEPLNPSVGLLVDDIDFSGLGTAATLFDIEQVEVLRGPQGTLHGANALAGLMAMRSAAPTKSFEGRLKAGVGDYGRRELGAVLSGPLVDTRLLGRLALYRHESDGFIRNAYLNRRDTNGRDEQLLRGRLRWLPTDRQQLDLVAMHSDVDNGYDAFSLDNTRVTLSDRPGRDAQRSQALGVHWQHRGAALRSELFASLADSDSEYSYDEDWAFPGIAPALEYASFDRYQRDRRSHSVQLRLSSAEPVALGAADMDWTAGLYGLDDDERLRRDYTFLAEPFFSRFQARTGAAFGQADFRFGDGWQLSAGLRLAQRRMDYRDSEGVDSEPDASLWGGKLVLSRDLAWGHVYGAVSRGYRAGGVNAGILAFPRDGAGPDSLERLRFFDEELLLNYEIGHKASFLAQRLETALTLFYMDRDEQQVRGSLVIPRPDNSTAFVDFTDNAASGRNLGLEWELRLRPAASLEAYFNLGLLDTRFDDYVNASGRDLAGREQAHAPRYQFATGLRWQLSETLAAELQWEGRDRFYFSDRHDAEAPAYELLHLRIDWTRDRWTAALWARNVLDEDYFIRGFGSFGNDPRKGYAVEEYRQFGDPRQLGASIELRF